VHKCDEKLIPVITNYLGAIISNGKTTETDLHTKVHEIVFELNSVAPKVLINVLPNMEPELKFDDLDTRAQAVQLFARMFAAKESTMPHTYYQLFNTFLTRFKDIHEDIRCVMIEFAQHFILTQKDQKLVQDVASAFY
jgi:sister-chromatid-cohesion protein PDS5